MEASGRDEGSMRGRLILGSGWGWASCLGRALAGSLSLFFPAYQGSARVGFISPVQPAHRSKARKSQNFSCWEGKNVPGWRQPPASCRGSGVHTVGGHPQEANSFSEVGELPRSHQVGCPHQLSKIGGVCTTVKSSGGPAPRLCPLHLEPRLSARPQRHRGPGSQVQS